MSPGRIIVEAEAIGMQITPEKEPQRTIISMGIREERIHDTEKLLETIEMEEITTDVETLNESTQDQSQSRYHFPFHLVESITKPESSLSIRNQLKNINTRQEGDVLTKNTKDPSPYLFPSRCQVAESNHIVNHVQRKATIIKEDPDPPIKATRTKGTLQANGLMTLLTVLLQVLVTSILNGTKVTVEGKINLIEVVLMGTRTGSIDTEVRSKPSFRHR